MPPGAQPSACLRETPPPDLEARTALRAYRDAYDAYFMKTGNTYAVRNAGQKSVLQAAEQHGTIGLWFILQLAAGLVVRTGLCSHSPDFEGYTPLLDLPLHPLPHPPHALKGVNSQPFPHLHPALPLPSSFLGIVDISDDEEEDVMRPRKKSKLSGFIDLTN
ncbi:hypothetical protein B0H13DRAFT_2361662 [Mycena leptocephala]|nr:hypothetical protein B0H13DRAFT_2361662 [Mycena leptocephala]